MSVKVLFWIVVLAALAGAAAWWGRDSAVWRGLGSDRVTGPSTLGPAARPLRKCVAGSQVTYTDQACPPGSRSQPLDGGSVTVLPAAPATATPPAAAASVLTPLRRLAGEGLPPDAQERRIDQALQR